jgi:hypothetical protein
MPTFIFFYQNKESTPKMLIQQFVAFQTPTDVEMLELQS